MTNRSSVGTRTILTHSLFDGLFPSEETLYLSYFKRSIWSLDEFCALMSGISPEQFKISKKNVLANAIETSDAIKALAAADLFLKFIRQSEKDRGIERWNSGNLDLSPWKFIKWAAVHKVPLKEKFLNALPLYLIELYLEFMPTNSALRTASRYSRLYQRELYLREAKALSIEFPSLNPSEIYNHPRMKNTERQIRELGGNYKKRTYLNSWIPKVIKSPRGRPPKYI